MVIVILSITLYLRYVLAGLLRNFLQGIQSEQVAVKDRRGEKLSL